MTGFRWTDEAMPTQFSLHRAVDGELVELLTQDDVDESILVDAPSVPTTNAPADTPPTTAPNRPAAPQAPTAAPKTEVIVCESADDNQPVNVGNEFVAPGSITALLRYSNLPENSQVQWLWTLDGRTEATTTKTLAGNGWYMHGLRSQTAIVPGVYELTVKLNGSVIAQQTVTVYPGSRPTETPRFSAPSSNLDIDVIFCERVADGEPVNPGTQFTKPRSLACLVKYRNLPADTELKWNWQFPGDQTRETVRTVKGNGWAWDGGSNDMAMPPGTYTVTVSARGQAVETVTITVR